MLEDPKTSRPQSTKVSFFYFFEQPRHWATKGHLGLPSRLDDIYTVRVSGPSLFKPLWYFFLFGLPRGLYGDEDWYMIRYAACR